MKNELKLIVNNSNSEKDISEDLGIDSYRMAELAAIANELHKVNFVEMIIIERMVAELEAHEHAHAKKELIKNKIKIDDNIIHGAFKEDTK